MNINQNLSEMLEAREKEKIGYTNTITYISELVMLIFLFDSN